MTPNIDIIKDFSRLQAECKALGKSNVFLAQQNAKLREMLLDADDMMARIESEDHGQRADEITNLRGRLQRLYASGRIPTAKDVEAAKAFADELATKEGDGLLDMIKARHHFLSNSNSPYPPVLDVCCSIRAFWYDKQDRRALFADRRKETIRRKDTGTAKGWRDLEIAPDIQADFTNLPFPNDTFLHVVFDPPHKKREEYNGGFLVQQYGILNGDWKGMLKQGFAECFRVLKPGGTLIFKWCELEIPLREILALTPEKPLYGHRRISHPMGTHWVAFIKANVADDGRLPEDRP